MVASVPELAKRHSGKAKRRASSPAIQNRVLGGLGEVRAPAHLTADRLDDRGMGVAGDRGAIAAVHVDVFGAVDVVHLRPAPWLIHHGLGLGDLPVRCGAAGKVLACVRDHLCAARWRARNTFSSSAIS